jgi:hypothetical protein
MPKHDDDIRLLSPDELPDALKAGFAAIHDLDSRIDDLKATHIEPIADARTKAWRDLKAGCDIARKDLDLFYKLWKRARVASEMEDEAEGERILANLKRAYAALQAGQTLDFLSVLEDGEEEEEPAPAPGGTMFEGDDGAPEPVAADAGAKKGRGKKAKAAPEPEPEPEEPPVVIEGSDEEMDGAGFTFAEGRRAGLEGLTRESNPHPDGSASHGIYDKGWILGNTDRLAKSRGAMPPGTAGDAFPAIAH